MATVEWLTPGPGPQTERPGLAGSSHESRKLLAALLDGRDDALLPLRAIYDEQSSIWSEWCATQPDYLRPLEDALERQSFADVGRVLEVSAGSGQATAVLAARFPSLIVSDSSESMLQRLRQSLPSGTACVVAESGHLPLVDGSVDLVVGLNAVPDLAEFRRVLSPHGAVLWVSSFGEETPLYVPPEVLASLWHGSAVAANAGHGDWLMLRSPCES